MPASRLKAEIARILQDEGYIHGFKLVEEAAREGRGARPLIRIFLKYGPHGERVISGIERISRPGRRVYFGREDVPQVLRRAGHQHPDDLARRHEWTRSREGRRRRRSALQCVVAPAGAESLEPGARSLMSRTE